MDNNIMRASIVDLVPVILDTFKTGGEVCLVVTGNSMWPLFKDKRDRVMLAPCDEPHLYDILLFRRDSGQIALHRVVDIQPNGVVINGDAQVFTDPHITKDRIYARVVSYARKGRRTFTPVDAWTHRLYITVWVKWLRPLRPYYFAVKGRISRVFKKEN